ncbi:hypothetical protein EMIT0347P_10819 [Pseudomonas sp. IT-347P]
MCTLPIAPNEFIGVPQLVRATLPISTRPDPHNAAVRGVHRNQCDIRQIRKTPCTLLSESRHTA